MTHLILHKVRGEPAFDVAEQFQASNGEVWWIIPTIGHRCYPYAQWPLVELVIGPLPDIPEGHPDHYACNDRNNTKVQKVDIGKLLAGLVPKIKRRI